MTHFVGLDVSIKETSVCMVDEVGKILCERKVLTEPDDIAILLASIGEEYDRIGIEAGPLSQWLVNSLIDAGFPVVCVETRHIKAMLQAQQINKSDRNDARGIAQMMRVGLFKPVHVKTLAAHEERTGALETGLPERCPSTASRAHLTLGRPRFALPAVHELVMRSHPRQGHAPIE